jgi:hypothetical protein
MTGFGFRVSGFGFLGVGAETRNQKRGWVMVFVTVLPQQERDGRAHRSGALAVVEGSAAGGRVAARAPLAASDLDDPTLGMALAVEGSDDGVTWRELVSATFALGYTPEVGVPREAPWVSFGPAFVFDEQGTPSPVPLPTFLRGVVTPSRRAVVGCEMEVG